MVEQMETSETRTEEARQQLRRPVYVRLGVGHGVSQRGYHRAGG